MGKYVENNLGKNEGIVKKAELNKLFLIPNILACVVIILIPIIFKIAAPFVVAKTMDVSVDVARETLNKIDMNFTFVYVLLIVPIIKIIGFFLTDLAITSKRVIGKTGIVNTVALDAPLNKVQNAMVSQGLWGKIFNYGTVNISTAAGAFVFKGIKNADAFKHMLMAQVDQYEEDKVKQQAAEMARSMNSAINK